jgi:hypothetical protein
MFDDGLGALARFYARGVSQAGAPSRLLGFPRALLTPESRSAEQRPRTSSIVTIN